MKTVLVTGASSGIGEACALHLYRLGHRVYAGVRNDADVPVLLDVIDQQIDAVAKQVAGDTGDLHPLVNNAGIARGGPLEYLPIEEWRDQLEAIPMTCGSSRWKSSSPAMSTLHHCSGTLTSPSMVAILLAMALADHLSLADVKNRLSEVVDRLEREHGRVVITKHGRPAAVLLSVDDLESLEETLEILSNPQLMADIREAEAEVAAGKTTPLTKDEARTQLRTR